MAVDDVLLVEGQYQIEIDDEGVTIDITEASIEVDVEAPGPAGPPGMVWKGAYSAGTTYAKNEGVSSGGASYISLAATNLNHTPASSPTWWELVASKGDQGDNGVDGQTIWNGAGAPSDGVGANGDFYLDTTAKTIWGPKAGGTWVGTGPVSLVGPQGVQGERGLTWQGTYAAGTEYDQDDAVYYDGSAYISLEDGNQGNTPSSSPTKWSLLASEGDQGTQGIQGLTGLTGAAGATPIGLTGEEPGALVDGQCWSGLVPVAGAWSTGAAVCGTAPVGAMTLVIVAGGDTITFTWTGGNATATSVTGLPATVAAGDLVTATLASSAGAANLRYYLTGTAT